jgi:hypothetical protein
MSKAEKRKTFIDNDAQRLSDLWIGIRSKVDTETLDEIGEAYLSEVLHFDNTTVKKFTNGDEDAYNEVVEKQNDLPINPDTSRFWEKVSEIIPNLHTKDDNIFLTEKCGILGVLHFTSQLDEVGEERSSIMKRINLSNDFE